MHPHQVGEVSVSDPEPRQAEFVSISTRGFHRIAYTEWGEITSPRVVVCVHGLSRQGRDFDRLAVALAREGYRVLCPDLVGRGRSGRLRNPDEYALPQYCMDRRRLSHEAAWRPWTG